jgi:hypothetical protein
LHGIITHLVDAAAPITTLPHATCRFAPHGIPCDWNAEDESLGSGVRHVTVYVAEDGGDFTIWLRQTTVTSAVRRTCGHTYEFLALATDNAIAKLRTPRLGVPR